MSTEKQFDIIIWGASGFTGRLVAEYLNHQYGIDGSLRWAMAGRSEAKLREVANEIGAVGVPIVTGNATDPASLDALVRQTRVICTTVGPYQKYGSALVAACCEAGTDYVDLSGEPAWMREMIDQYGERAKRTGARIVHSCGFDSIPFDMAVFYAQQYAREKFGGPFREIKGRVKAVKGKASGGTVASMVATIEAGGDDPVVGQVMTNPYGLAPDDRATRPRQPNGNTTFYDEDSKSWVAPFIMAVINTKNVHRSNTLMQYPYGEDFLYSEMMMVKSSIAAKLGAAGMGLFAGALSVGPLRSLLKKFVLPAPGEGPNAQEREEGFYVLNFYGKTDDGQTAFIKVSGDRDPGYGSTSKMIGEAAVCLALDIEKSQTAGGFWTPASAMGAPLIARLTENAGLTFSVEG